MAQDDILKVVKENPAIIRKDIYKKLGVTWTDGKQINSLLNKKYLKGEWGVNGKRFWITEEGKKHLTEVENGKPN